MRVVLLAIIAKLASELEIVLYPDSEPIQNV